MRAAQQLVDRHVAAAGLCDPDAGADAVLLDADLDRHLDGFDQRTGDPAGALGIAARQTQGKLVIADPREDVAGRGAVADARPDLQQRLVAAEVPVDLVEFLELVETEQQDAHLVVGVFQHSADVVLELAPVGQLGQRIAHGDGLRLKLGRQAFRPFAALVADAAGAEHHQRDAKKIHKRRLLGLGAENLLQDHHAAPVDDGHVGHEADGENHQYVDDFPPGRSGQRERNEPLGWLAQQRPR